MYPKFAESGMPRYPQTSVEMSKAATDSIMWILSHLLLQK